MFKPVLIFLKTLSSIISIFLHFPNQDTFPKSLNMWRIRFFELQKSKIYHEKALEKFYPMMIFSKTSTETLSSKNPKTLKLPLKHGISMKTFR